MKEVIESYSPEQMQKMLDTSESYSDILRKMDLFPTSAAIVQLENFIDKHGLDVSQLDVNRKEMLKKLHAKLGNVRAYAIEEIFDGKHPAYPTSHLCKRLIKEGYKENKCEICGISEWMNKPISLQLHHKDDNHFNHKLDNLQILCPNCHSQTDSYAGRNSKKPLVRLSEMDIPDFQIRKNEVKPPPVQRDELKQLIRSTSFLQIGRKFGVTDNSIRKWCDKYGLPRKTEEIKKISDEDWESV